MSRSTPLQDAQRKYAWQLAIIIMVQGVCDRLHREFGIQSPQMKDYLTSYAKRDWADAQAKYPKAVSSHQRKPSRSQP